MLASQKEHVEVVDKLLQHGAKVDLQTQVIISMLIHEYVCIMLLHLVYGFCMTG